MSRKKAQYGFESVESLAVVSFRDVCYGQKSMALIIAHFH